MPQVATAKSLTTTLTTLGSFPGASGSAASPAAAAAEADGSPGRAAQNRAEPREGSCETGGRSKGRVPGGGEDQLRIGRWPVFVATWAWGSTSRQVYQSGVLTIQRQAWWSLLKGVCLACWPKNREQFASPIRRIHVGLWNTPNDMVACLALAQRRLPANRFRFVRRHSAAAQAGEALRSEGLKVCRILVTCLVAFLDFGFKVCCSIGIPQILTNPAC